MSRCGEDWWLFTGTFMTPICFLSSTIHGTMQLQAVRILRVAGFAAKKPLNSQGKTFRSPQEPCALAGPSLAWQLVAKKFDTESIYA